MMVIATLASQAGSKSWKPLICSVWPLAVRLTVQSTIALTSILGVLNMIRDAERSSEIRHTENLRQKSMEHVNITMCRSATSILLSTLVILKAGMVSGCV